MTKNNYRRLGDYIKKVNVRNTEDLELPLMGLSIQKYFIPSIANTIGTNMKTYKIIERDQFAYGPVTSRNGDKITIALFDDYDKALISQAYVPFKIKDKEKLLPKYLMMWFSRPEFDRYARFKSHGSARETFDWEEMCEVELPIPSIEKQREIVADYQAVENKIKTNEAICEKLEETAQTIYRRWFEEFEFPDKDGKPYKSNGGKMVWSEELEKEVPEGWEVKKFSDICLIGSSKRIFKSEYVGKGIPFYRGKEITLKKDGESIEEPFYISEKRYFELKEKYGSPQKGDILMTAVGTIGSIYMVKEEGFYFKDGNIIWFKNFRQEGINYYLYDLMQSESFNNIINEITIGSTQNAITITSLGNSKVLVPKKNILNFYLEKSKLLNSLSEKNKEQNQKLHQLQSLLLGRMTLKESEVKF